MCGAVTSSIRFHDVHREDLSFYFIYLFIYFVFFIPIFFLVSFIYLFMYLLCTVLLQSTIIWRDARTKPISENSKTRKYILP
jgi:hypothetical protein